MSELLPCPFCGGEYTQVRYMGGKWQEPSVFDSGYRGECCDCGVITAACYTEAEAIAAWNTRADTATLYEDGFYLHGRKFVPERTCRNVDEEYPYFECSECGCHAVVGYGGSGTGLPHYCPNCGAKVVSE